MEWYFEHWGKAFWIIFIVTAVFLVGMMTFFNFFPFDIIFALVVIVLGVGKLSEEYRNRKIMTYQDDLYRKVHDISQQLEHTFDLTSKNMVKYDHRFFKIFKLRDEYGNKLDKFQRDLVKKMINIENKLNRVTKYLAEKEGEAMKQVVRSAGTLEARVLAAVKHIPRGTVTTYKEIAKVAGKPKAAQAVGQVLKRNIHLADNYPLHRVVRSDGDIGSFGPMTKKGVREKRKLLKREGIKVSKDRVDLDKYLFKF